LVELVYTDKKRKSSLEMQRKPAKVLEKNYLEFLHHLWKMFHDSLKANHVGAEYGEGMMSQCTFLPLANAVLSLSKS